jgi:hypothetical protein
MTILQKMQIFDLPVLSPSTIKMVEGLTQGKFEKEMLYIDKELD